jgi:hypothetical protein
MSRNKAALVVRTPLLKQKVAMFDFPRLGLQSHPDCRLIRTMCG